ncbi:hypothetical protein D9613_008866 [Agrocybe pediades]|uniref:C2H2-type domain-containing protein n=1 Tax=Agrocybe pediades TaxID=84607 RepID=A0A8H4QS65_9AGAR|nr:hypothetical protein D9613_008866 [Agrocybe pediades]
MSCITCTEVFPTFRDLKDHCLATRHAYFSYKCGSCDELYSTLEGLDEHMSLHYSSITDDPVASEVEVDFATVDDGPLFADSDHSDANEPSVIGTLEEDDNEASSDWERLSGSGVSSYVTTGSITPPLSSAPSEISISSVPSGFEDLVEGWDNLSSSLDSARATSPSPPTQDPLPGSTAVENPQPNPTPSLELPAYFQEIMQKYFVWSCSLCNRLFPTERILHDHQRQKHLALVAIRHPIPLPNHSESDSGRIAVDGGFFDANRANTALETAYANASFPNNCSICGKRFRDAKALDSHCRSSPKAHRFFQCSSCNNVFISITKLQRHREAKHGIPVQQPAESPQTTGLRSQAHTPASIPQPPPPPSFKCRLCGIDMPSADALKNHELSAADAHKPFQCTSCSKGYWTQHGLDEHRLLDHSGTLQQPTEIPRAGLPSQTHTAASILQPPLPRFKCKICGKIMPNAAALQSHEASGAKAHRTFQCSSCSKAFLNEKGLEKHRLSKHSGPVEVVQRKPSFKCTVCGKEFDKLKKLKAHVLSEANSHSTWKCSICDRVFITRELLKKVPSTQKNIKTAPAPSQGIAALGTIEQGNTGERTFTCLLCPSSFHSPSAVAQHLESGCHAKFTRHHITAAVKSMSIVPQITVHQITGPVPPPKQVVVPKATTSSWNGTQFQCFMCSRGFKSLVQLNNHLRSPVHDQKEFKCPKCKTKFALISGLVQHLESHTCGLSDADEIINFYDRLSTGFSNRLLIA